MIRPNLLKNFISSYVKTAFTECLCDNPAHRFRRTNDVTLPSRNLKYLSKTENPAYKKTELNISCQNCFNSRLHNFQTNTDNLLILLLISSSPLRGGMETASYTLDLPPSPTGREAAGGDKRAESTKLASSRTLHKPEHSERPCLFINTMTALN